MSYLFELSRPAVPINSHNNLFPVRRIYCVGRNYAEHAREMGFSEREQPFFFSKPADAVVPGGGEVPYPTKTENLHHEIELVVAIGRPGSNIPLAMANDHIYGYAVGIDLTRRDLQKTLREKGWPWDMAKGFDFSAPISPIMPAEKLGPLTRGAIRLSVNGKERQHGDISRMIWSIPEVVSQLSQYVALAAGDLIFTGTPEGVGAVVRNDFLEGSVEGVGSIAVKIV